MMKSNYRGAHLLVFDNMVAVWSKEDACGGNETLGLKKKANELLGTREKNSRRLP